MNTELTPLSTLVRSILRELVAESLNGEVTNGHNPPKRRGRPVGSKNKPKRHLSAAGRAAISRASKKRWAEYHRTHKSK